MLSTAEIQYGSSATLKGLPNCQALDRVRIKPVEQTSERVQAGARQKMKARSPYASTSVYARRPCQSFARDEKNRTCVHRFNYSPLDNLLSTK
jgi:hypothetical protein